MGCRKYSYFLILWIIAYSSPTLGQTPADSLIRELALTHNEELQMEILSKLSNKFDFVNFDTSEYYIHKFRINSKNAQHMNNYHMANWLLTKIHKRKGNLVEAVRYLLENRKYYEEIGNDFNVGLMDYTIGQIYYKVGSYEKAAECYYSALKIYRRFKIQYEEAKVHYELGRTFRNSNDLLKAKYHAKKCLELIDLSINQGLVSKTHNLLGIIYYKSKNYDSAIYEYTLANQIAVGLKDYKKKMAISLNNIGEVFMERNEFFKADSVFQIALKEKRLLGDNEFLAGTLINLGKLKLLNNKPKQAIKYLEEIVENLEFQIISQHLEEAATLLLNSYQQAHIVNNENLDKIVRWNIQFIQNNKSLKIQETKNRIQSIILEQNLKEEIDYHYKNSIVAKNKTFNIFIITSFLILSLIGLLYYREKRFKRFVKSLWQDLKDS